MICIVRILVCLGASIVVASCAYRSSFQIDQNDPTPYQDSVRIDVRLQDTLFLRSVVNEFIHGTHIIYRGVGRSKLLDTILPLRRPKAEISITNLSHHKLLVPSCYYPAYLRSRKIYREGPCEYTIRWVNDTGESSVVKPEDPTEADRGAFGPVFTGYWSRLGPGEKQVLCDSLDILIGLADHDLPLGEYSVVVFFSNQWRKHPGDNYWTGAIKSDAVRFYLQDGRE